MKKAPEPGPLTITARIVAWSRRNEEMTGLFLGIVFGLAFILVSWVVATRYQSGPGQNDALQSPVEQGVSEQPSADSTRENYDTLVAQAFGDTDNLNGPALLNQ